MSRIPLPRLLDTDGRTFIRRIRPLRVSVDLNIVPLSTASIELPEGEEIPARSYVEVYTSIGSAGLFRVRSPQNSYGNDISASELEHAVVEVGDWLVRANYKEMMAAGTAMQTVFSHYRGSMWQLGSVAALGTAQIALQANYDNVLTAMLALLEQIPDCMMTFDFSTSPRWTLSFAKTDTVVSAEGRLSRNINNARIIYDDSELCTRAYYEYVVPGSSDGQTAPTTAWATLDADTIGTYGVIEREVPTGNDFTAAEALRAAQEYIRKHKTPNISIEINAEDLSQVTGEALDSYRLGKLYRLAMPKHGITKEEVITGLSWDDVYGKPNEIVVMLADEEATAVTFLHDLDAKGGSGGGGGGGRKKADDEWKEFRAVWEVNDYHLMYEAQKWDKTSGIIEKAGLKIDSAGALIYAEDTQEMIGSKIKALSNQISLEVSNATTKAALILKITGGVSNARLSANVIDIDGVVSALTTKTLVVQTLSAANITVAGINDYYAGQGVTIANALEDYFTGESGFLRGTVFDVQIVENGTSGYKLQKKSIGGGGAWEDAGTFSRAISSDTWSWVNGHAKVVLQPQNQTFTSPNVDGITKRGDPVWAGNKKSFTQDFTVQDEDGQTVATFDDITFNTAQSYNAGWAAAAGQVDMPDANTSSATFTVKAPQSTVDSTAYSHQFSIVNSGNNAVEVLLAGRAVAKLAHNKYDAGKAAGDAEQYELGWKAACALINRVGNVIYGPSATDVGGSAVVKYTANYTASKYTASQYTASSHSHTASTFAKGSVNFKPMGIKYTNAQSNTSVPSGATKFDFNPGSYNREVDSYTASTYTASTYTASSFTWS